MGKRKSMQTLAIYSIKGGVGKTAASVNLAYLAAASGMKTLLWDLDPQGASSFYFRIKPEIKGSTRKLIAGKKGMERQIKETDFAGLHLMPADFSYRHMDLIIDDQKKHYKQIRSMLDPVRDEYDLVILDCPPSISLVSENVFYAADQIAVPMIPTTLSLRTYELLMDYFKQHDLKRKKILPFFSMVDRRKKLHREVVETLPGNLKYFLKTHIPYSSLVEQMGLHREPVVRSNPRSAPAKAYQALWTELASRLR